jgi:hypothetical protein
MHWSMYPAYLCRSSGARPALAWRCSGGSRKGVATIYGPFRRRRRAVAVPSTFCRGAVVVAWHICINASPLPAPTQRCLGGRPPSDGAAGLIIGIPCSVFFPPDRRHGSGRR